MKKRWIIVLAILGGLLLAAALLVGTGLLNVSDLANRLPFGPRNVTLRVSPDLPAPQPDLNGVFVRRENNSVFIGTGNVQFHSQRETDDQPPTFVSSYDGPVVEVVISRNTQVLCDITDMGAPDQQPVNGQVQQIVEPVSDEAVVEDTAIWVWGERQGDRFLASTLLILHFPGDNRCLD